VLVTVRDSVLPLEALAEGKQGDTLALLRSVAGALPTSSAHPAELAVKVILSTNPTAADAVGLKAKDVEAQNTSSRLRPDRLSSRSPHAHAGGMRTSTSLPAKQTSPALQPSAPSSGVSPGQPLSSLSEVVCPKVITDGVGMEPIGAEVCNCCLRPGHAAGR